MYARKRAFLHAFPLFFVWIGKRLVVCPTKLETLEGEGRDHGGAHQGVAAKGPSGLPHTRRNHHLWHLAGLDIGAHHLYIDGTIGPFTSQLQRIAGVEVPELSGIDSVGS